MKKEYYIKLSDGQVVPVTEEVYREYKRPQWREAKQKKVRQMREFSLEYMTENGMEHIYSDNQKLVEEIAEDNLMLEMLMKVLETLTDYERSLINELYFNEKSEREVAKTMNIPHQTVHWQKGKTIKKLKKFFDL